MPTCCSAKPVTHPPSTPTLRWETFDPNDSYRSLSTITDGVSSAPRGCAIRFAGGSMALGVHQETRSLSLSLSLSPQDNTPTVGRQLIYQNQLLSFLFPIKSLVIWTGRAVKTNRILKGRNWKYGYDISSRLDTQYTGKGQEPSNVNCIIRRGWQDSNWVASPTNYRRPAASHATRINKRWGKKKDRFTVNTTCHLSHGQKYTANEFSGLGNVQTVSQKRRRNSILGTQYER